MRERKEWTLPLDEILDAPLTNTLSVLSVSINWLTWLTCPELIQVRLGWVPEEERLGL